MKKVDYKIILFILVGVSLFLFSSFSPIHSLMNLQYDQSLYNLIGKGMKYGKIPYIDLIDHKGIYLFSLFALGNIIGETHHIGMFVISLIYNYIFTIFAYKISSLLLSNEKHNDNLIALLSAFASFCLLNTYYLNVGGFDCEATIIPFITIAFYLMLKYILSDLKTHPLQYIFIYGLIVGLIIFTKANAALIFVGFAVFLLFDLIKKKEFKTLFLNIIVGFLGIIVALLPGTIYCLITGSFADMIEQTFIVNFRYIGTGIPGAGTALEAFVLTLSKFKEFCIITILSIFPFWALVKNKRALAFYILSLIFSLYAVFLSCRPYTHYLILLVIFYIPIFTYISLCINKIFKGTKGIKIAYICSFVIFFLLLYSLNLEISLMNGSVQDAMAKKVVRVYKDNFNSKKDNKVLVVGFAMYLYEALDKIPDERYFATPVVLRKDYSKPFDEIVKCIKTGREDLVITAFDRTMVLDDKKFRAEVIDALSEQYDEIANFSDFTQNIVMYKKR